MHRRVAAAVGFLAGRSFLPSIFLCIAASAWAQSNQAAQHVVLPPAIGGTPLSQQIHAEAAYVAAYGDMVESVAMARKINAQAVALEIQNSVAYVDAYFKRREINRERRAKEDPNYMEREKRHQEALRRRVDEQYQDVLRGDVTNMLNWLLRELADPVVAYRYLPPNATLLHSTLDRKLDPRDLEQIRLSDGGNKASRLVFAAADGKPLQPHWPLAMRRPEFSAAEESYERTLAEVVAEIGKTGQASSENQGKVMQALNALFVALDDAYPKERRRNPNAFLAYATAKRFLQSSLAATNRAGHPRFRTCSAADCVSPATACWDCFSTCTRTAWSLLPPNPAAKGSTRPCFRICDCFIRPLGRIGRRPTCNPQTRTPSATRTRNGGPPAANPRMTNY